MLSLDVVRASFHKSQRLLKSMDNFVALRLASSLLRLLVGTIVALSSVCAQNTSPLHLEKEIPLPDVEGRIDHFSADVQGQRLFIAALENGTVEVIDIRKGERSTEVKGLVSRRESFTPHRTMPYMSPVEETEHSAFLTELL